MVFSSHLFVYWFLPATLALYCLLPRRGQHLALTLASYLFYGWANPAFMGLMLLSTTVDYLCGLALVGGLHGARGRGGSDTADSEGTDRGMPSARRRKLAVTLSVVSNLSLLGFFKYFNFGVDSWNTLAAALGVDGAALDTTLRIALPLGISFYTFQSMSYTIDIYRGHARALANFVDFACYVSLFPQLVAGPIIRFSEVADQLRCRRHTLAKFARGVSFFALGMSKKVLLANPCGKVADTTFGAASLEALDAWFGVTAYAFQIYFDFSGYSDMAIGLGLMLGFVFPKNFDSPYLAESITDFWRRWHLSLSSWLRDYLYLPLGGNRRGRRRTYVNLALVMLLGGLWHGAAWNFVIWGGFHGALLALERARGRAGLFAALPRAGRVAGTFLLVLVSWVFFRASDLPRALDYLAAMAGLGGEAPAAGLVGGVIYRPYYLATFAVAAAIAWWAPQTWEWTRRLPAWKVLVCLGLFWAALAALATQGFNPFIYFIF